MAAYSSSEVKSGLFIFVCLGLLLALTVVVGKYMAGETHSYHVIFGNVGGLETKAPVYFAGHEVGKVEGVEILQNSERPMRVTVSIKTDIQLREDSQVVIDTLGLMGEKFVELSPGTLSSNLLKPGGELQGTDPIPMHLMVTKLNLLADRMDVLTQSLNPLIEDFNDLLGSNQEEINKMIANFYETSANLRDMTHDLKYRPWRLVRKG